MRPLVRGAALIAILLSLDPVPARSDDVPALPKPVREPDLWADAMRPPPRSSKQAPAPGMAPVEPLPPLPPEPGAPKPATPTPPSPATPRPETPTTPKPEVPPAPKPEVPPVPKPEVPPAPKPEMPTTPKPEVPPAPKPETPAPPTPPTPSPTIPPVPVPPAPTPTPTPEAPAPAPAPLPAAVVDVALPGAEAANAGAGAALQPPSLEGAGDELGLIGKLVVQGDQAPFSLVHAAQTPGVPPRPPVPGVPNTNRARAAILVPWARGFKIADNQSPRPQDRFFSTFNYFDNLAYDVNHRLGGTFQNVKVYRQNYGFEKTFLDGNASFGMRVPINSITADSPVRGLGRTHTDFGNITAFTKFIVWKDATAANLVSTGLAVTVPTGPTSFGGAPYSVGFRDVAIQPFVGYFFSKDRVYFQGFESIDVPTDSRDVTMLYNDAAVGYFAYRSEAPKPFLRAIAPTFETHVNVPLNHRGIVRAGDPAITSPTVDLTIGVNFFLRNSSAISFGYVDPVTGPRAFNAEWTLLYNMYFGKTRSSRTASAGLLGN